MIEQIKYYKNIICQEEIKRTFNIPDFANRVPQGNGHGYLSAGLPNITGAIGTWANFDALAANSALYGGNKTDWGAASTPAQQCNDNMYFDASRSSSIYGNSSTVQPPATKVNFIVKY